VLSVLWRTVGAAALGLSSLVRVLGGPELAGVFCLPVPDVVELDNLGVLDRDGGRADASADSSASGSSSSSVGVSADALAGLITRFDGAESPAEGISSNWANSSSSVRAFLDAIDAVEMRYLAKTCDG